MLLMNLKGELGSLIFMAAGEVVVVVDEAVAVAVDPLEISNVWTETPLLVTAAVSATEGIEVFGEGEFNS